MDTLANAAVGIAHREPFIAPSGYYYLASPRMPVMPVEVNTEFAEGRRSLPLRQSWRSRLDARSISSGGTRTAYNDSGTEPRKSVSTINVSHAVLSRSTVTWRRNGCKFRRRAVRGIASSSCRRQPQPSPVKNNRFWAAPLEWLPQSHRMTPSRSQTSPVWASGRPAAARRRATLELAAVDASSCHARLACGSEGRRA